MGDHRNYNTKAADLWSLGVTLMELTIGAGYLWWEYYEKYDCDRLLLIRHATSRGRTSKPKPKIMPLSQGLYWYIEHTIRNTRVWNKKDLALKDLLVNKLLVAPQKRVTAAEALEHDWTKGI